MWKNFIPEKYHEMVVTRFPAFQSVSGEFCSPPENGWEFFSTHNIFYGSGPNYKFEIVRDALQIWGEILNYGEYRVVAILVYADDRLEINYRDDIEQRTEGCYCVLPINGKMYFRQSEAIQPDIIRDLFGYLPDELTAWHIEKLREHFGDDQEKTVKPHWRLKDWVGDDYEKIEPLFAVRGNYDLNEWKVIVRRESITVENKNDDRKYSGGTSHTFITYTDDETRTEIYHDAFVTLEVLTEEEDNCCIPIEITVNESGIVVDVLYGKDEYYMGMDEVEEKCGGLPWFDDEASVMYTLLS